MTLEIVKQVIEDLELEERGATLYYALDPYDIVSYCFPIGTEERLVRNLDQLADEQAALYEVASARTPPPVILEEYVDELDSIFDFLQTHVGEAYDKTRTLAALINQVRDQRVGLADEILRGLKRKEDFKDFNVVLAVVLGIYRLGSERFLELFNRVAQPATPEVKNVLWELSAEYRESETTDWLKKKIWAVVPKEKQGSAEDDARAIDRLFFLNSGLEKAHQDKRLPNRHIFLYLSSAGRSAKIFGLPEVQARFPVIDGRRYSLHRLPEHIFTRLVHSGPGENPLLQVAESLKTLRKVEDLLRRDRANRLNRKLSTQIQLLCTKCLLEEGTENTYANCPYLTTCRAMHDLSERVSEYRSRKIQNLSLMSAAQQYFELRSVRADSLEAQKFLDFFVSVTQDKTLRPRNDERIQQVNRLIKLQIAFRNFLPSARVQSDSTSMVKDRKVLHLFSVFREQHRYRDVFRRLSDCENAPLDEKLTHYEEAASAFTDIDAPAEEVSEAHELVRSILYLDCPTDAGDTLAFDHAQEMLDNYPKYKADFWLVLTLVAPRLRRFNDGEWYAMQAISHHPDDPRLHYARAFNCVQWIRAFPEHPERETKRALAISEQKKCIELCPPLHSPYPYLRAVSYNNLAFFYCFNDSFTPLDDEDLKCARENLDQLKQELPKSEWLDKGINFFHTEALVEWYEAAALLRAGELEKARSKLVCADREIKVALSRRPKEMYQHLQQLIDAELKAISLKNAGTGQTPVA